MANLEIKLDIFEGPLDLLLKLIDKNKIDIYNIPISKLTEDYISYIKKLEKADLEDTSQFIFMASILLQIKSKMLIPAEKKEANEIEEDPREELMQKLIEYKKYKMAAQKFSETEGFFEKSVFKSPDLEILNKIKKAEPININEILEGIDLKILYNIFEDILKRKENKTDKIRSNFKSVTKDLYNIKDKINYIKDLLFLKNKISFNKIFKQSNSKIEVVVTFLAILELIKEKNIKVIQDKILGEIIIFKGEDFK